MNRTLRLACSAATAVMMTWGFAAHAQENEAPTQPLATFPPDVPLDAGWNTRWALLFSLNNILVQGSILSSPIAGTIGGSYVLSPNSSIRAGFNLSRQHNPVVVEKITTSTAGTDVTTFTVTPPGAGTGTNFHSIS